MNRTVTPLLSHFESGSNSLTKFTLWFHTNYAWHEVVSDIGKGGHWYRCQAYPGPDQSHVGLAELIETSLGAPLGLALFLPGT